MRLRFALLAVAVLSACGRSGSTPTASAGAAEPDAWKGFSGERAMEHVRAMVALGPRPAGTPALEACRVYLEKQLSGAGWEVRRQTFEDDTPHGKITFHNIRARFPGGGGDAWTRPVLTVAGSHYDTKWFQGVTFVGANDAGSSTGVLLEMARAAAAAPTFARSVELVFFDGEEALVNFTARDGLYGSRHYAKELRTWPDAARPRYGVVFDMVGDADLRIEIPANSSSALRAKVFDAAEALGFGKHFGLNPGEILDDHVPLGMVGLEVTNFIDFTYSPWHTSGDTLDKLSAASLEITGRTGLLFLQRHLP